VAGGRLLRYWVHDRWGWGFVLFNHALERFDFAWVSGKRGSSVSHSVTYPYRMVKVLLPLSLRPCLVHPKIKNFSRFFVISNLITYI
jgi:hypothetical protein